MPAGDNPHSISEKKAALRESPKQSKNAAVNQQARASPFPKVKVEVVGTKRPHPNGPLSPTNHHAPGNPGANGHLVYVRRKLESDQSKGGASAGAESTTSLSSKKPVVGGPQEQSLKHQNSVPNTQLAPVSASPAAAASVPALHSASLPANLSFEKQSPGKVSVNPSVAATASPPPAVAASVPALHSATLPANLSFGKQSPGKVSVNPSVAATASPPPAAAASVPALHSASLPANLSFGKQSPGKVSVHPSVAATASPPPAAAASVPALHSASLPSNLSFGKQSPGKVTIQSSVVATASPPPAAAASVPALHSTSLPAHTSFGKQSPGKVTVQSSVVGTASPPQRNVVPTAIPQNFTAANTASPPQRNVVSTAIPQKFTAANNASPTHRNVVSTAVPQNITAANTASPTHRNVVSTAVPQNFTAASTASPTHRNVVSTAVPQSFTAANTASPTHRNVVSTAVPQNFTAANMAPCNVATASTASHDAVATTTARSPASLQRSSNQDWKQRFIRLQAFLRNNEQSGQEEYIRMLQSLSSVGRSKHAVELEKRAVNLLIEEGKELQKMKALNVLGKLPPTDHPSLSTHPTFAMRLPFQPFPARR